MRTRELRITSVIVVFPVALILVSLLTILCLAISSQIKSYFRSLFPSTHSPRSTTYATFTSTTNVSPARSGSSSRLLSFGTQLLRLNTKSFASTVLLVCVFLFLAFFCIRTLNKVSTSGGHIKRFKQTSILKPIMQIRTHHALDSCLEKLAAYRIPGTLHINPKKAPRVSQWIPSLMPGSFISTSPPTGAVMPSGAWLLSRNGNGTISLQPSPSETQHVIDRSSATSSSSSTTSSSKPYIRSESLSSHTSSSHVYIPDSRPTSEDVIELSTPSRAEQHIENDAPRSGQSCSSHKRQQQRQQQQHSEPQSLQQPPQLSKTDITEEQAMTGKHVSIVATNTMSEKEQVSVPKPDSASVPEKAEKRSKRKKHAKKTISMNSVKEDVEVFPVPAAEPKRRAASGNSQKAVDLNRVSDAVRPERQVLCRTTAKKLKRRSLSGPEEAHDTQKSKTSGHNTVDTLQLANTRAGQAEGALSTKPKPQSWYSPFSTGLEIDFLPRAVDPMRRSRDSSYGDYQLFGDSPSSALSSSGASYTSDNAFSRRSPPSPASSNSAVEEYGWSPMHFNSNAGYISPLSSSPPSPPHLRRPPSFLAQPSSGAFVPPLWSNIPALAREGGMQIRFNDSATGLLEHMPAVSQPRHSFYSNEYGHRLAPLETMRLQQQGGGQQQQQQHHPQQQRLQSDQQQGRGKTVKKQFSLFSDGHDPQRVYSDDTKK